VKETGIILMEAWYFRIKDDYIKIKESGECVTPRFWAKLRTYYEKGKALPEHELPEPKTSLDERIKEE